MGSSAPGVTSPAVGGSRRVVVIGNPNAGKTTIFNRLTGLSQRVGNYPGVTVEKKCGRRVIAGLEVELVDLPGTYSLAAHSPDEMVAVDVLLGHELGEPRPDLVLQVVDASNLERNLYLLTQVLELGVPAVVALNMVDLAVARGLHVSPDDLARKLGVPVVAVEGHRGVGIAELEKALGESLRAPRGQGGPGRLHLEDGLHRKVEELHREVAGEFERARGRSLHEFEVLRAVIDEGGHAEARLTRILGESFASRLSQVRQALTAAGQLPALEARVRYSWIRDRIAGCVRRVEVRGATWSERLDRLLTHRIFGYLIFGLTMLLVFEAIFSGAQPLMDLIDQGFERLGGMVSSMLPEGALRSLIVDGAIAGVGMVVVFLPQILILFFFIGLLEDCGYMARAAFLMDKVMQRCGLSGKSFIPMLSGFACAVPGVMATRVIEDRKDRLATILVTPLMSCSARLPVYSIFIGTFIPDRDLVPHVGLRGVTLFSLYLLGILSAVAMAWILRGTILRGPKAPFVLELPSYKLPSPAGVVFRLHERAKAFLLRAGTTILLIAVIVWGLAYFPHRSDLARDHEARRARIEATVGDPGQLQLELDHLEESLAGEYLRDSYFGRAGRAVEPLFRPLGWDWKISMAVLASFPAREVVISTLGIIYNVGEADEESTALRAGLLGAKREADDPVAPGAPVYNVPVALSILVFFALCCQCGATVATIRRETSSWGWAVFAFSYMTALAYIGALAVYQIGVRL